MAVKQVQSATRVLAAFEALADHQPLGVGALSRLLDDDKSAVQRALITLEAAGWIRRTPADETRWEVTSRVLALAHGIEHRTGLRERARTTLAALRDECGETTILNVAAGNEIVVLDVVESTSLVRTVPTVGFVVPTTRSAAGQAILAYLSEPELVTFLGHPVDDELEDLLAQVRRRGWSVNDQDASPGASAVGAPVLGVDGRPVASLTISGPSERLDPDTLATLGRLAVTAARRLSTLA